MDMLYSSKVNHTPRLLNFSRCHITSMRFSDPKLTLIGNTSVFYLLILRPEQRENFSSFKNTFFNDSISFKYKVVSSANWLILKTLFIISIPLMDESPLMLMASISATMINRRALRQQPCLTPLSSIKSLFV